MIYTINGELYHHGILGQKWGKQQGPPYPLDSSEHSDREKKFGYKKSIGGGTNEEQYEKNRKKVNKIESSSKSSKSSSGGSSSTSSSKTTDKEKSEKTTNTSKEPDSNEKTKKKKQTYREKLEAKYKEYGLTDEEAKQAADKKIKTMKGVAIGVGVAAATVGAVVAYKKLGYKYIDRTIPKGTTIQTISEAKNRMDIGESFYTSITKGDKTFYGSKAFTPGGRSLTPGVAQKIQAKATDKMKIASERSGIKAMDSVLKSRDQDVQGDLLRSVGFASQLTGAKQADLDRIRSKFENNTKLTSKEKKLLYDSWNITAVKSTDELKKLGFSGKGKTSIYDQLKKSGYSGFLDMNDIKYGKISDAATVMIDRGKLSADKVVKSLSKEEMDRNTAKVGQKFMARELAKAVGPQAAILGATGAAAAGMKASKSYDEKKMRQGASRMSLAERKTSLEKQASKYISRYDYASTAAYNKAKENWVNSQLKKIDKEQGTHMAKQSSDFETKKVKEQKVKNKKYPDSLEVQKNDSAQTKRIKENYNSMSDKEFKAKTHISKKEYAKRVEKYGDPYKNSKMSNWARNSKMAKRINKAVMKRK